MTYDVKNSVYSISIMVYTMAYDLNTSHVFISYCIFHHNTIDNYNNKSSESRRLNSVHYDRN